MPTHLPIWFHGTIPLSDIADALASKGIHLRTEMSGRMVADSIPTFIRKEPDATIEAENVVLISKTRRKQ